ncbi:pheromone A receptor-domain-containing protein [Mycena vulgaris]|nr:pheromone A receptor-domain-containing protein [Mycena vulgaris]
MYRQVYSTRAFGTVVRPHTADSELARTRRIPREAPHCRSLTLAARGTSSGTRGTNPCDFISHPIPLPLLYIFVSLCFVLVLVVVPWNSGTTFYIMWAALACLNQFVNSIAWRDTVLNKAPVVRWCDISTLAASVGIPTASLCINRQLYQIASVKTVLITPAEKRRAALIDALICVLFPLVYVALQYIVQGPRFNIYQQIGCYPALYNSPPLLGLISAVYGILALRAFLRRRAAFAQFLSSHSTSSSGGPTPSRYLRLMALALTAALLTTPLRVFAIYLNLTATPSGRGPRLVVALEFSRRASPACALIFFAFFGFAVEARRHYALFFGVVASAFWSGAARLGVQRPEAGFLAAAPAFASSKGGLGGPSAKAKGGFSFSPASTSKSASKSTSAARKPISNPIPIPVGLPTYSFDGTGSFTDVGTASPSASSHFTELKRAGSSASASSAATSRFVERFEPHAAQVEPETPATATSFASSSPSSIQEYALPLHVAWHDTAYPASPASPAYPYIVGEHDGEDLEGEEVQWSPASDAHSISMERFSGGGGRTLV